MIRAEIRKNSDRITVNCRIFMFLVLLENTVNPNSVIGIVEASRRVIVLFIAGGGFFSSIIAPVSAGSVGKKARYFPILLLLSTCSRFIFLTMALLNL